MVAKKRKAAAKAPRKKVDSVEGYLASVPAGARATLLKLRKTIQAAAPEATEEISYQVPTFKQNGGLVAYAAFPEHCSFFVMSTEVVRAHAAELEGYSSARARSAFPPTSLFRRRW